MRVNPEFRKQITRNESRDTAVPLPAFGILARSARTSRSELKESLVPEGRRRGNGLVDFPCESSPIPQTLHTIVAFATKLFSAMVRIQRADIDYLSDISPQARP